MFHQITFHDITQIPVSCLAHANACVLSLLIPALTSRQSLKTVKKFGVIL